MSNSGRIKSYDYREVFKKKMLLVTSTLKNISFIVDDIHLIIFFFFIFLLFTLPN